MNRDSFFDHTQHGFQQRQQIARALHDGGDRGVRVVDLVTHAAFQSFDPPRLFDWLIARDRGWRSSECEDTARAIPRVLCMRHQPRAKRNRRPGRRLADINQPVSVGSVGYVQPDSGQSIYFFSIPCPRTAKTEPSAGDQQPFVSIDIEALLRGPTGWAGVFFELVVGELVAVGQDMALHRHQSTFGLLWGDWRGPRLGGMPGHEWIPRFDWTAIEQQLDSRARSWQQAMEDHGQVRLDVVDEIAEVVGRVASSNDAIELLPDHQRSGRLAVETDEMLLRALGGAFE